MNNSFKNDRKLYHQKKLKVAKDKEKVKFKIKTRIRLLQKKIIQEMKEIIVKQKKCETANYLSIPVEKIILHFFSSSGINEINNIFVSAKKKLWTNAILTKYDCKESHVIIRKVYEKNNIWKNRESHIDKVLNMTEEGIQERKLYFENNYSKKKCGDKFERINWICLVNIAGWIRLSWRLGGSIG